MPKYNRLDVNLKCFPVPQKISTGRDTLGNLLGDPRLEGGEVPYRPVTKGELRKWRRGR